MAWTQDTHTTETEKDFISKLGTGKFTSIKTSRLDLLKNYKASLFQRTIWDKLAFDPLLLYVEYQIQKEVQHGS